MKRVGELLVDRGLIQPDQLEEGLESQVLRGGRLGSNLVELGFLSLDPLAEVLAVQHGVGAVTPAEFSEPQPDALAKIPPRICARYKIVPLRLDSNGLALAMQDPQHKEVLDYLKKSLQLPVTPYVAPQLRIAYLLERYCGIPREKRYLRADQSTSPRTERRSYLVKTVGDANSGGGETAGMARKHPASGKSPPGPAKEPPAAANDELQLVFLDEVDREAEGLAAPEAKSDSAFEVDIDMDFEQPLPDTPQELVKALETANSRDELVRALTTPVVEDTTASILFLPRGDLAITLAAWGTQLADAQVRALVVPLNSPSLLQRAMQERCVVSGAIAEDSLQTMIANYLQSGTAQTAHVAPIVISERVINLLCVQTAQPNDDVARAQLATVAARGSSAYARLIRQNTMRLTGENKKPGKP